MHEGAEEFSFRDLGRSMHYCQGSRKDRPPDCNHYLKHSLVFSSLFSDMQRPSKLT